MTLVPTRARASEKDNVIPSKAEVLVDCRVPPGMDGAEVRAQAEAISAVAVTAAPDAEQRTAS